MTKTIHDIHYLSMLAMLKNSRKQTCMTQQELAAFLGKAQSYVSKYETGEKRLDVIELQNICLALGISMQDFLIEHESSISKGGSENV